MFGKTLPYTHTFIHDYWLIKRLLLNEGSTIIGNHLCFISLHGIRNRKILENMVISLLSDNGFRFVDSWVRVVAGGVRGGKDGGHPRPGGGRHRELQA